MMEREIIAELRGKAAHQLAEMRRILDTAGNEGLSAEAANEYDRRETEHDALSHQADAEERLAGLTPEPTAAEARAIALPQADRVDFGGDVESASDENNTFERFLRSRGTDLEARANLKVGTDSAGGYLVPKDFSDQVVSSLVLQTSLLDVANVITTSGGNAFQVPIISTDEVTAAVAEEGTYTQVAPTIGQAQLGAYKAGHIVAVSDELLADSGVNLADVIRRQSVKVIGSQLATWLATGNGSTAPQGINACTVGVTTASTTAITANELIDTQHSVAAPYRATSAWFMADSALKAARQLKDTNGQYLLQPSLQAGIPATLLGNPVYVEALDAVAAGKVVAVYGDANAGFLVRRAGGVNIKVLNETLAASGQVGFRVDVRIDSKITDASALRSLKMKAS